MFRYIMKRIIGIIPVLFCVSVVVFIITRVIPGDPAAVMLGPEASPEAIAAYREQLGLTDPYLVQYGRFLWVSCIWIWALLWRIIGQCLIC